MGTSKSIELTKLGGTAQQLKAQTEIAITDYLFKRLINTLLKVSSVINILREAASARKTLKYKINKKRERFETQSNRNILLMYI